jgi:hypothetical protein
VGGRPLQDGRRRRIFLIPERHCSTAVTGTL